MHRLLFSLCLSLPLVCGVAFAQERPPSDASLDAALKELERLQKLDHAGGGVLMQAVERAERLSAKLFGASFPHADAGTTLRLGEVQETYDGGLEVRVEEVGPKGGVHHAKTILLSPKDDVLEVRNAPVPLRVLIAIRTHQAEVFAHARTRVGEGTITQVHWRGQGANFEVVVRRKGAPPLHVQVQPNGKPVSGSTPVQPF